MDAAKSVLGGVKKAVGIPGVLVAMCQDAGPEFAEDFVEADGSEVFDAGQFVCFESGTSHRCFQ
jgi:hypothetical protein